MSKNFAVAARLMATLAEDGEVATGITDVQLARIADSPELIDQLRKAIADIVTNDRQAKQGRETQRSRVRSGSITKLADHTGMEIDRDIPIKLKEKEVTVVRQLMDLSPSQLITIGLLSHQIAQLEAAMESVGLSLLADDPQED